MSKKQLPDKVETKAKDEDKDLIKRQHDFYDIEINKDSGTFKDIQFDRLRLCNTLKNLGFFRYDLPDGAYQYVRVNKSRLQIVDESG